MGPAVAVAALAVTATSAVMQHQQARRASRAQARAAEEAREQQRIGTAAEEIRGRQQRRQALREQRIRRARILAASQGAGVGGSAAESGAVGALGTLTGANLGALGSQMRGSQAIDASQQRQFGHQQSAASAQQRAQLWQGVGQLSGSVFQGTGGFPGLFDEFRGAEGPPIQGGFGTQVDARR
jgi:hypothetical protein